MPKRLRLVLFCAYRSCDDEVVKTLTSRHGYSWNYCHRHHIAAARARMNYRLSIPHTVRRVA